MPFFRDWISINKGSLADIHNLVGVAIAVSRSEGSPLDLDLGKQWVIHMIIGEIYLLGVFVITRWCRRTLPQRSFVV